MIVLCHEIFLGDFLMELGSRCRLLTLDLVRGGMSERIAMSVLVEGVLTGAHFGGALGLGKVLLHCLG